MGIPVVLGRIVELFEAPGRAAALVSDLRSHKPESGARQGCIVEQGTHAELVALGGHYSGGATNRAGGRSVSDDSVGLHPLLG